MRVPVKRAFVSVRDAYGHSRIRIFTHRRQARNSIHTTATCIPIPRAYSPVIERLKALPEVAEALKLDAGAATPLLERSVDIFRSVGPEEYRAVVMLLARAQGMNGDHEKCVSTLTDLQRFVETSEDEADSSSDFVDISFALSKALWNAGRFDEAAILSKAYREASTTSIDQSIPSAACILRSKSFVNLSNVSILMQALLNDGEPDDNKKEFILCEFRDAVSQLHNTIYDASSECYFTPDDRIGLGVAYVASLNNLAVAEVCFDSQSLDSNNSSVSGVSSWLKALAILDSLPEKDRQGEGAEIINDQYMQASDLVKFVKAQIMLNLSSSLLSSAKNADTPKIPHQHVEQVQEVSEVIHGPMDGFAHFLL